MIGPRILPCGITHVIGSSTEKALHFNFFGFSI